jgi:peptidoglycan/LPS O-acetylase OafA/YrhL
LLGLSIAGVSTTVLFAFLSWHLIEKRFLRLRKRFSPASAKIATELHPEAFKPV